MTQNNINYKPFESTVLAFIGQIESLSSSFPYVKAVMSASKVNAQAQMKKFLESKTMLLSEEGAMKRYQIPLKYSNSFKILDRQEKNTKSASELIPRSYLISLVSQYDSFLGNLIKDMLLMYPDKFNSSEKTIKFSELMKFKSIDDARDCMVETEIESVLRKSHSEQFDYLENQHKIELRKGLDVWPKFIELTERRNLFVHCDGIVSSQYLRVCKYANVTLSDALKIGDALNVTDEYFVSAYHSIYEIGIKLSQVMWRKLAPNSIGDADRVLNQICFDLIDKEDYVLARKLLDFATLVLPRHSSDEMKRVLIINQAQAHRWAGKKDKCSEILKSVDWSACKPVFKLSIAVLNDEFEQATNFMTSLKDDAEFLPENYESWPLFKEFRKSDHFLKKFNQIYGVPFSIKQITQEDKALELDSLGNKFINQISSKFDIS